MVGFGQMRGTDVGGHSNQFSQCSGKGPSEWKGLCLVYQPVYGSFDGFRADAGECGNSGTDDRG